MSAELICYGFFNGESNFSLSIDELKLKIIKQALGLYVKSDSNGDISVNVFTDELLEQISLILTKEIKKLMKKELINS